jgi:hypothetical protein
VPLGYASNRRTKQLVVDVPEATLVRWMFEQAAAGVAPSEIAADARTRSRRRRVARSVSGSKASRVTIDATMMAAPKLPPHQCANTNSDPRTTSITLDQSIA